MATSTADLMNFLKANQPKNKFVPYCHFDKEADALTVYFEGDADYTVRLNDHMTLHRSLETNEIIGCRVKGVSGIIEDLPNYVKVKNSEFELSVVFLPFRGGAGEEEREAINTLAREAAERGMVFQSCL